MSSRVTLNSILVIIIGYWLFNFLNLLIRNVRFQINKCTNVGAYFNGYHNLLVSLANCHGLTDLC